VAHRRGVVFDRTGDRFRAFMIAYLGFRFIVDSSSRCRRSTSARSPEYNCCAWQAFSTIIATFRGSQGSSRGGEVKAISVLRQRRLGVHHVPAPRRSKDPDQGRARIPGEMVPEHGRERVLIADDAAYYRKSREVFIKPPELPQRFNTEQRWGCPYDCGCAPSTCSTAA
jgi:hypothetical protein